MTTSRRRLPPGAKWVELPTGDRRVEFVTDVGIDPRTGRRRQTRRRFRTVDEALDAYREIATDAKRGTYVARSSVSVKELCESWLESRHGLRSTTLAGYRGALKPAMDAFGSLPVRLLEKRHIVDLVSALQASDGKRADGKPRRPWRPRTVNLLLFVLNSVLEDALRQGLVVRNVAHLVDRLPQTRVETPTFTRAEVSRLLVAIHNSDMEHAWHLALYGLRRGEVAGLRWDDIDADLKRLTVRRARVSVDGAVEVSEPKSERSGRTLPISRNLREVLQRAQARQLLDAELAGDAYDRSGYVVVNKLGAPIHPDSLSGWWELVLADAGLPKIRLHDARHTCGTLLHLQGVPTAIISAWLGHADAAFTMRVYVHSQPEVLDEVAKHFDEVAGREKATPDDPL